MVKFRIILNGCFNLPMLRYVTQANVAIIAEWGYTIQAGSRHLDRRHLIRH